MSEWTHPQCEACWIAANGTITEDGAQVRRPVVMREAELEVCCFCGRYTIMGIFVRADGRNLLCGGVHQDAEVDA